MCIRDRFGHAGVDPNFGGGAAGGNPFQGAGFDFTDIFDSFFGGGFGGGRRQNPNAPRRGSDVQANIAISFEEDVYKRQACCCVMPSKVGGGSKNN